MSVSKSRLSALLAQATNTGLESNADENISQEALSPRARAIIKQFTMTADGANMYLGHKVESLAAKIAKLEEEIEEAKAAKAAAKNAKISNEAVEVSIEGLDEVALEGWKGAISGYKGGAKAFWTKDGKLSFPSMKRYHDWMEEMQKEVDEKSDRVKALKLELKALVAEAKADQVSKEDAGEEVNPILDASDATTPVLDSVIAETATDEPVSAAADGVVGSYESVEAALVDAMEVHAELVSAEGAQERLEEIAAGLESIAQELEVLAKEGGATPQTARCLSLAVEAYTKPVGLESGVPSCEQFGGATTRIKATEISLESVQDKIKQVWEAVKAVAKKVYEAIKAFVARVFSASERLTQRGQKLIDAAKSASGSPKAQQIELGPLAAKIAIEGKVPSNLAGEMAQLFGIYEVPKNRYEEVLKDGAKGADMMLKLLQATDETIDEVVKEFATTPSVPANIYSVVKSDTTGSKVYETKPLPGGKTFSLTVGDGVFKDGVVESQAQVADDVKIATLSTADIEKIGEEAVKIGNMASELKDASAKVGPAIEKIHNQALGTVKEGMSDATADKAAKAMRGQINQLNVNMKIAARVSAYVVQTALAFVQIAEKSLAQYEGAAAETKALPAGEGGEKPKEEAAAA